MQNSISDRSAGFFWKGIRSNGISPNTLPTNTTIGVGTRTIVLKKTLMNSKQIDLYIEIYYLH